MVADVKGLVAVLRAVPTILERPGTDVMRSRYTHPADAVADVTRHLARVAAGDLAGLDDLDLLFAPTGALQEISIDRGWGDEFPQLAARFDRATGVEPQAGTRPPATVQPKRSRHAVAAVVPRSPDVR